MVVRTATRRRVKIAATVDPELARAVDAFVAAHPALDRSKVIDEALRLWYARQQEAAMEAQFAAPQTRKEKQERAAWRRVQQAAAARVFGRR